MFLIFDNRTIKTYSLSNKINNSVFKILKNKKLFKKVKVGTGGYGVIWNDDLDLSEFELWKNGIEISTIKKLT